MIVITDSEGKILGKTKSDPSIFEGFTLVPFDAENLDHKKAKFLTERPKEFVKKAKVEGFTGLNWLMGIRDFCFLHSIENSGKGVPSKLASNSELRRWLENKAVLVNGEHLEPDELMGFPIFSVVLFPNSNSRCTLL